MFTEKVVQARQQALFYLEDNTYGNGVYIEHNDFSVGVQMCGRIYRYLYTSAYELYNSQLTMFIICNGIVVSNSNVGCFFMN